MFSQRVTDRITADLPLEVVVEEVLAAAAQAVVVRRHVSPVNP